MNLKDFITPDDERRIVDAIKTAERNTSGEIRVHIQKRCWRNPVKRATHVFNRLGMACTRDRNGILIFLAVKTRKFAIIGDVGINDFMPPIFWKEKRDTLAHFLAEGNPAEGLVRVIEQIGETLDEYFPYELDDINELPDDISYVERMRWLRRMKALAAERKARRKEKKAKKKARKSAENAEIPCADKPDENSEK